MSLVAMLALLANVAVALMLYRWRQGDANMRSVWLCSRNDAIGNLAVLGAAGLVGVTGSAWPDLLVALLMAVLALVAAKSIITQALMELERCSIKQVL
jgi:Co/Zn/Cd efflux system component